jgi:DNA polymerase-3 subunit gamma/tau
MSYQVLARKWRPQTFEDVVGQSATAQTLRNAILQNRIAHAYLFAGARGVGKTTTARILAKALNCAHGPTATPCNICDSCKEITSGNSIDVLEIDAASNRGIDEIRELRENVKYAAARDRFKVFIIDEVHMLTTEAFNALLKTLEEPPSHVVFILATTELHKVPATILSRCQHFNFRAISYREILNRLHHIAREEQVQISEEALDAIARGSEGSMRDAQSLLEQVISFCGSEVEDEAVRNLLGIIPQQILEEFTEAIVQSDSKRLLLLVDQLARSGRNLQHFVREMLSHFRNLLMVKIAGEDPQLIPLTAADLARLKELAVHFSEEDLTRFFSILVSTEGELRWSSQPRFHLEIGLMKLIQVTRLTPIEQVLAGLEGLTNRDKGSKATALEEETGPRQALRTLPAAEASQPTKPPILSKFIAPGTSQSSPQPPLSTSPPNNPVEALKFAISNRSPMLSSLIEHALDLKFIGKGIEIQFASQNKFHCEMLQAAENVEVIKELAESVIGEPQQVKIVMVNGPSRQSRPQSEKDHEGSPANPLLDEVKDDSNVKAFLQVFQGEITDVKDLKK